MCVCVYVLGGIGSFTISTQLNIGQKADSFYVMKPPKSFEVFSYNSTAGSTGIIQGCT